MAQQERARNGAAVGPDLSGEADEALLERLDRMREALGGVVVPAVRAAAAAPVPAAGPDVEAELVGPPSQRARRRGRARRQETPAVVEAPVLSTVVPFPGRGVEAADDANDEATLRARTYRTQHERPGSAPFRGSTTRDAG
jgi:hypothetical protein